MTRIHSLLYRLSVFHKRIYLIFWRKRNSSRGNSHLGGEVAVLKNIPFSTERVYLRPTSSDVARVSEFLDGIYFSKSYLHDRLRLSAPTTLIDVGANIGLSTLSLIREFPTITKVVAIEAEAHNFDILRMNFDLWSKEYPHICFEPMHRIATSSSKNKMKEIVSLAEATGQNTASGTFRFEVDGTDEAPVRENSIDSIAVSDIVSNCQEAVGIIMKIDIEGGEEHLLSENSDWVARLSFLTIEVHDRYHSSLINSSRHLMRVLSGGDFALVAEHDVLHCYSRGNLFADTISSLTSAD